MARRQGRSAGARRQTGRRHHRPGGNRNRVEEQQTLEPQIRHRNRPGHHQLRAGLCGDAGRMPTRSPRRTCSCCPIPQLVNPGEVRDEDLLPSFLYLPGATDFPAGTLALPWDADAPLRGRPAGAEARRGKCRPPGLFREIVALAFRRVDRTSPLLPFRAPEGVEQDLARGGQPPLPGAPARGLGRQDARRAVHATAGAGHRAGILRRRGARIDARSRRSRPATRTSPCSKSRRPPSTPGSSATPTGASASRWAT